jgi:predicted Zn finger-like uncharacterized protein
MIKFRCPHCAKRFKVADDWAGKKARCKDCGNSFVVPTTSETESQPAATGKPEVEEPQRIVVSFAQNSSVSETKDKLADTAETNRPTERKLPMRIRRLMADAEHMNRVFHRFPLIRIVSVEGNPPDRYRVEYNIRGVARGNNGQPIYRDQHLVEIQLTSDYPRQSPKCRLLTPIFHPNFDPTIICVGDHWTAAEKLADLVVRIGEMIAYQAYNIKSPLDGEAAMWADLNQNAFPVDRRSLTPPEA